MELREETMEIVEALIYEMYENGGEEYGKQEFDVNSDPIIVYKEMQLYVKEVGIGSTSFKFDGKKRIVEYIRENVINGVKVGLYENIILKGEVK